MLRKGYLGEYKLKKYAGLHDRFSEAPVKNEFSHPMDACQYAAMIVDRAANVERSRAPQELRYQNKNRNFSRPTMNAWT
jgi:hypothetical protein